MTTSKKLAQLIFPQVVDTIDILEARYPHRLLPEGAMVTRFAPSPTGFLHTGSLFASLISWRLAKQSKGCFFVRLEDTDQKREISGSGDKVLEEMETFGITPDESFVHGGAYGPYIQSERKPMYDIVIKHLIETDRAYPCFCTHEELDQVRKTQESLKENTGYYGVYARCRNLSHEMAIQRIMAGEKYVIRFRSPGDQNQRVSVSDVIRGTIEFPENIQDIVIMKGDGLPTYHFAHLVDDHFMRTTHVTRGEEWMASLPIHVQLFDTLGWERPIYAHLPVIMKLDDGKRRKLSKRKDEEASVRYFLEKGYPIEGFLEYLMTLANTDFEEWRLQHLDRDIFDFNLDFSKMSLDGALFDLEKINSISKECLGRMSAEEISKKASLWAKMYQPDFYEAIQSDPAYFTRIMSIERGGEKPRKDYDKYSDIFPIIQFMYDAYFFDAIKESRPFDARYSHEKIIEVLQAYLDKPGLDLSEEAWFENLKVLALDHRFAPKPKEYKKNPDQWLGHVGDFAEIIRIAVSAKKSTPNFFHILQILGYNRIAQRISHTISLLRG